MGSNTNSLLDMYPEFITMEQFYQICHISKRHAAWLLQSGALPCEDSGKKTRRYRIRTVDAADFLQRWHEHPDLFAAPVGIFSTAGCPWTVTEYDKDSFLQWLIKQWEGNADLLSADDAAALTGYSKAAVTGWVRAGKLYACRFGGRLQIAKCDLQEFLIVHGFEIIRKSVRHQRMLAQFTVRK